MAYFMEASNRKVLGWDFRRKLRMVLSFGFNPNIYTTIVELRSSWKIGFDGAVSFSLLSLRSLVPARWKTIQSTANP
eukprot:514122-Amphidinium_carterae.1